MKAPVNSTPNPSTILPIFQEVDALVIGASSGAVAAALEIRRSGRRVLLVSDLSYLGEESAGALNLWPVGIDRTDPLVRAVFPSDAPAPVFPGAVKYALESALFDAGIPFLYLARPVALLTDGSHIAGAVIAARTSLFAIRCRTVVDASRQGIGARLAGLPLVPRTDRPAELRWTLLAAQSPVGWPADRVEPILPAFRQRVGDEEMITPAFRLSVPRATLGPDPRAREAVLRAALLDAQIQVAADIIPDLPDEVWTEAGPLKSDPSHLTDVFSSRRRHTR